MTSTETYLDYCWKIRLASKGHLDSWIEDYFGGLFISHEKDGCTVLTGKLPDISAVYGLILQLRNTEISLLSLHVERSYSFQE